MYAQRDEVFLHESEIIAAFEQYPQIIKNTQSIIDNCKIDFDFDSPKNKKHSPVAATMIRYYWKN